MAVDVQRVRVLGGLAVDGLEDREIGSRKGRLALKVLAVARGEAVPVDRLADALWGDGLPADPAAQVGVLVSRLRSVLGSERIVRIDAGYALRGGWLDLDELIARSDDGARALAGGHHGPARAAAEAALVLVRGPVLPEEEGDWLLDARAAAEEATTRAHRVLALAADAAGDHVGAAAAAEAALRRDAYDEVALQVLMRAAAAGGRTGSGIAAYVAFRERLAEELGLSPSAETEALHDRLVLGGDDGRPVPRRAQPGLVGRDAELAVLDDALAAVEAGPPGAVVLVGEAGIGKTAVVDAWTAGLVSRAAVLTGRCDDLGRDLPLQPVADAVAARLGGTGDADAAALLGDDAPVLADLLGRAGGGHLPAPSRLSSPGGADAGRSRLFGALLAVVERMSGAQPCVLVLDDVQRAGPLTLAWLAFALRRGRRLLVVATGRPGGPGLAGATTLAVGPIDRASAAELLVDADPARVEALHTRSGGNPLFLLALAGAGDELPGSVRDAARRQAADLGPAGVTVAAAAVLGRAVDLDLLAEVLGRPAATVLDDLEVALAAGLLDERGSGLAFHHELVRDALADGVPTPRRRFLHGHAARALARRPGADPLAVAVHAGLGGLGDVAIEAYVHAAEAALARYDVADAGAQLDTAIGLGGSEGSFALRARVRMIVGDLDAAAADAAEATAGGGSAASLEVAAWIAYYRRRYDEARRLADAGIRRAGDDVALRASCRAVAGRVRHGAGDLEGARRLLQPAEGAPPAVRGVIDVWRSMCLVHAGEPEAGLAALDEPLLDPDHLAHPWAGMHGRFTAAMALGHLGRPAEALERCDDLDRAVVRAGDVGRRFLAPAANIRGWLLRYVGAAEEADACNLRALDATSDTSGAPRSDAVMEYHYVALLDLADGRLLAGDTDGAASLAARLEPVDGWQGNMAWHQRHRLELLRARLDLAAGDADSAAARAEAVAEDAGRRGAGRYLVLAQAWSAIADGRSAGPEGDASLAADLARRASLEGWWLLDTLARARRDDALRAEAARQAAAVVAGAGGWADGARRLVASVLDGP